MFFLATFSARTALYDASYFDLANPIGSQRTGGTNRREPFDGAREWRYYTTVDELLALRAYLTASTNDSDVRLAQQLQEEFQLPELAEAGGSSKGRGSKSRSSQAAQEDGTSKAVQKTIVSASGSDHMDVDGRKTDTVPAAAEGSVETGMQPSSRPPHMQVPDPFQHFPPRNGEYLALDDETPRIIANKFSIDVDTFVRMNHHMYDGLHAQARFKGGTQTFLPTPSMSSLRRPANASPIQVLSDIYKIIVCELEVMPVAARIAKILSHWKAAMQKVLDQKGRPGHSHGLKELVHATLSLEHALALPVVHTSSDEEHQQTEQRPLDMRLLPADWISGLRHSWVQEMESVATLSHMGLLLEELHLHGLASWRELRACCTSQWYFHTECKRWQTRQAQARGRDPSETPLVKLPDAHDRVVYFRRGHCIHLNDIEYPQKPWDQCPDVAMALCLVEERFFFRQLKRSEDVEVPLFCLLRLRPICQGADLVKKKIYIYNANPTAAAGQQPAVFCGTVEDFRQTYVDVQHVPMPDGVSIILPHAHLGMNAMTPGLPLAPGVAPAPLGVALAASAAAAEASGLAASGSTAGPSMPTPSKGAAEASSASHDDKAGEREPGQGNSKVYTQRAVNEYLVRVEGAPSPTWMNLDSCKYVMQR